MAYKQVFYAESCPHGHTAGISIGLGMTTGGQLGVFIYDPAADAYCQAIWPRQVPADVPHMVGVINDGTQLFLYLDGDRYVLSREGNYEYSIKTSLDFTTAAGTSAAIGGVWLGRLSPYNSRNAHWVDLGRFAFWDRALDRDNMVFVNLAGGASWHMYEIQRIGWALTFAGWPADWRAGLDPPHSSRQMLAAPNWDVGTSALDIIQRAVDSVGGVVFCAADGTLTYHLPTERDITASPDLIFTDGDGTSIDDTFAYTIDDNDVVNRVTATTKSGLSFEIVDQISVDTYGERPKSIDTDLYYAVDATNTAARLLNRYKQPILRCPVITVDLAATPDAMFAAIDLELGDTVGLDDLPVTAPAVAMTITVESIAWDIDAASGDWKVTFEVSPGQMYTHGLLGSLVLDSATLGG